jgi:phage tail sheath gpL-like
MSSVLISLTTRKDTEDMAKSGQGRDNLKRIMNELNGISNGRLPGKIVVNVSSSDAVAATATITSTGTATNAETMSLCNVTLTAKTSGAVAADGEFDISGTVATQATNIAAAINAATGLKGLVTASAALGVVTVTAQVPGVLGNAFQMSESLSNVTVTQFTGGTGGSSSTSSITLSRV